MVRFRYTSWDGSQRVRLDPDRVFERLARYLSETDDLDDALDRLLREGMSAPEFEVVGIDELVSRLRAELQRLYDTHNLDHALDRHADALEELLGEESDAVSELEDKALREQRSSFLARLPRAVDEAIGRLLHYPFTSSCCSAIASSALRAAADVKG
jgi:DNA helicase HerA-like ATPase